MKIVTAAVIESDGLYLLARRGPGENHAGFWEFPGGKLQKGEILEGCLVRELLEELSIESFFEARVVQQWPIGMYRLELSLYGLTGVKFQLTN